MGGGIKSKFKFPIPGRSSKKPQVQTVPVSGTVSKAQRILGADGLNIGSSRVTLNPGRSWETGSIGGISIALSESDGSQDGHDDGLDPEEIGVALWEEESAIIPRQVRSAHGSSQRHPTTKRSAFTPGNESRDHVANQSIGGRRLSTPSIDTHYDSARVPLAISQQTSNSAMAMGFPTKVDEVLDVDGMLAGPQQGKKKKKKPARLDLSRLRTKGSGGRSRNPLNIEAVLDNRHTMPSPSFASHAMESALSPRSTADSHQRTARKLTKQQPTREQSPPPKEVNEAAGLHQLYRHYEQMSFQDEETSEDEFNHRDPGAESEGEIKKLRPASTFTHSLIAPTPTSIQMPSSRGQDTNQRRQSRSSSHDSRMDTSPADFSNGLRAHPISIEDYAGSVSSRHTRTSKASPSCKSLVESDRLQNSVLSLSDSSDDEVVENVPSAPPSRRQSLTHEGVPENPNLAKNQQNSNYQHGSSTARKFTPSLVQVDEHLAVRLASRTQNSRSPSNNTLRSSQSSMSTLTPAHLSPANSNSALSTDTVDASHNPGYGVQQARAVSFVPLASTVEAAAKVAMSEGAHHFDKALLRKHSNATSRFSQPEDHSTPPLSPGSVERYPKSRESLQKDAPADGSGEGHNARLMAVTRQEEMLLAALRQKRAKMREIAISEAEEDEKSRSSYSSQGSFGPPKKASPTSDKKTTRRPSVPSNHALLASTSRPKQTAPLPFKGFRSNSHRADGRNDLRKDLRDLRDVDVPSASSRSDLTERTPTSATESSGSTTFDSRNDRAFTHHDQPTDGTNTTASSVDFSDDYMEDSDGEDLVANERRTSRMQYRRGSAYTAQAQHHHHHHHNAGPRRGSSSDAVQRHHQHPQYHPHQQSTGARRGSASEAAQQGYHHLGPRRGSNGYSNQYRKDSLPSSSLHHQAKSNRLQDVPEVEPPADCNEDIDADDSSDSDVLDGFPQPPPMPPPSWPLPPRPAQPPPSKPSSPPPAVSSPSSSSSGFLHPSSAMNSPEHRTTRHLRGKRSMVRLSAVGRISSPMPWLGDDD